MWKLGRVILALLLGQILAGMTAASSASITPDPTTDGRSLFCMESANNRQLIDAAIKLGLAGKGKDDEHLAPRTAKSGGGITVERWRQDYAEDFQYACTALVVERAVPASAPASHQWLDNLVTAAIGLISVLVGAGLTLGSTVFTTGKATSQQAASALHTAVAGYHRACHACLISWRRLQGRQLEAAMDQMLDAFAAELQRAASRRPKWRRPVTLDQLVKELDADIRNTNWPPDDTRRQTLIDSYLTRLEDVRKDALEIVAGFEHPWQNRKKMRAA
jgi:hypothetical protein